MICRREFLLQSPTGMLLAAHKIRALSRRGDPSASDLLPVEFGDVTTQVGVDFLHQAPHLGELAGA